MEMGLLSEKIPWSIADPSMVGWYHESMHATTGNGSVAVCPHFAVSQNTGTRQQRRPAHGKRFVCRVLANKTHGKLNTHGKTPSLPSV